MELCEYENRRMLSMVFSSRKTMQLFGQLSLNWKANHSLAPFLYGITSEI